MGSPIQGWILPSLSMPLIQPAAPHQASHQGYPVWSQGMENIEDVHAPSSEAMVVVLERQLHAVKINEGDAVQGAFDQLRDLYVKLSAAGVDYPENIKCYKALSLLPESWGPLVVNLNGMKDSWSLEWIRAQVLQEEFRRKELTVAAGEGGGSAYGMKGFKGRSSKKGKAKEGSRGEQHSGGKRSNKGGKRCGGKCWYCHVEGHPWFKCRKLPDGWRPGQPSIEGSKGVHGAMGEGMGSEEGDGGAGGHGGMFYHVGEACSEDTVVPASKVALHRSSHWVIDTGAFMTMTNREDLLDEVRPSKAATVVSATGQVVPVRGEGRAMFMGADGRLVGLKRVLIVPGLCANLLSTKALSEAGMKMEMMGIKVFKATLDGRVLWDLRGGKDMHRSMWEIPVLPWKEAAACLAAEAVRGGHASHVTSGGGGDGSDGGLLVHGGGALPSVTPSTGETDWLTAHRRFGHVALPQLQQLFKEEGVKGLRIKGEPKEVGSCVTCLTSKFSRFPFHSAVGQSSDPVELVHVDLVGPMKVNRDGGALYSMTMVDDYTRLTWSFPLAKKSDAARVIIEEWLPMVERESVKRVKAIRSDRGGEFLGAEFRSWLKRHGIKQQLTTAYSPQSNGVAERANRTIIEGGRTILVDSGLPLRFWPLAIRHATVIKNRVLTHVGGQHWVPMEKWSGKKPLVDMLCVFGCMGFVHVPKEKCDKLQAAAVWAVHLGLARGSKGWLMWDPKSNTIFTTRDAKFMEGLMFKEWSDRGRSKVTIPLGIEVGTNDPLLIPIELSSSSELTEVSTKSGTPARRGHLYLSCFTDATRASDISDATSHGGYICCVGGSPVSWKSKKQGEIAHSSTESEYMALFHGVKEVVWMRRLLEELGQEKEGPTPVFCDSQGAIAMARNAVLHGLNKHMHIKWHWVRKEVKKGTISLHYINTTKQPADFLTKQLAEHQHWSCATLCGMSFN
ncbi:unnamed protein product [Closterium sp. NIES-53]